MNATISCPDFSEQARRIPPHVRKDFLAAIQEELFWCIHFAQGASRPSISFREIRETPRQMILEFAVNDLGKERKGEYNWHGQNTSQWVYAGCVLFDRETGRVSRHH